LKKLDFKCWWGAYDGLLSFYEYELAQEDYEEDTGDSGCSSDEDDGSVTSMALQRTMIGALRTTRRATMRMMMMMVTIFNK